MSQQAIPGPQSQHNEDYSDAQAIYAGAKRRIAALEQQLEDIKNTGPRRRSYSVFKFALGHRGLTQSRTHL